MWMRVTSAAACAVATVFQAAPPDTDIFVAQLARDGGTLTLSAPVNISRSPGYDNQPAFTADGSAILFTSGRGGRSQDGGPARTDIYRYDLRTRETRKLTETPESEYSPTVMPDGRHISVVRVEADGTQRLWRFTMEGRDPAIVLADVKPVGYHAWADARTLALFVLGQPATLQIADTTSGRGEVVARNIGRSLQRMPDGAISFVQRAPREESGTQSEPVLTIMRFDVAARKATELVQAVAGAREADLAWMPDGTLLMAHENTLYTWRRGEPQWTRAADFGALGVKGVTRMAVAPKGDLIALVAAGS
jgi:WD40 repeat protein